MSRTPTTCHTFTGAGFDVFDPAAVPVLEDVAHHLAMKCRFGGATPVFYSVADHAVRVASAVFVTTKDPRVALLGLHHDNVEAYVCDIPRPYKDRIWVQTHNVVRHPFEVWERSVLARILPHLLPLSARQILADTTAWSHVRQADDSQLEAEFRGLFPSVTRLRLPMAIDCPIVTPADCLDWHAAELAFLRMHLFLEREILADERRLVTFAEAPRVFVATSAQVTKSFENLGRGLGLNLSAGSQP